MTIENDEYNTMKSLRNDYPTFYFALYNFLESLEHHWYLTKCYDKNLDGSYFSILCHDDWGNTLSLTATKNNTDYDFEIFKTIINDKL